MAKMIQHMPTKKMPSLAKGVQSEKGYQAAPRGGKSKAMVLRDSKSAPRNY